MRFAPSLLAATALVLLGLPAVAQADSAHLVAASTVAAPSAAASTAAARPVSAAAVPAANPVGRLEVARQAGGTVTVSGWSFDRNALTTAERIDIWQTAPVRKIAGHAFTTQARPDVNSYYKITGNHGWVGTFAGAAGTDTFCAYGINIGAGATTMIGCAKVVIPTSAPIGNLDRATVAGQSVTLAGWAYDPDLPTSPDRVLLTDNGTALAPVTTAVTRSDINSHFHTTGAHGWQTTVTATAGGHTYCATAVNLGPARANVAIGCKMVSVALAPSYLAGTVQDGDTPISGVDVVAETVTGQQLAGMRTGADGSYRLELPVGTYHLCVMGRQGQGPDPLGYADQCASDTGPFGDPSDLTLAPGEGQNIYFSMVGLAGVAGTVTDAGGAPLTGVVVSDGDALPNNQGSATTASDGTYTWLLPAFGDVQACFTGDSATGGASQAGYLPQCGERIQLTAGHIASGVNISLDAAAELVGQITAPSGYPLGGVEVSVGDLTTLTGGDGTYALRTIRPGTLSRISFAPTSRTIGIGGYSLTGYVASCLGGDSNAQNCQSVTTEPGKVYPENGVLPFGAAVSGQVTDAHGKALVDAIVEVTAVSDGQSYSVNTGRDGTWRISALRPGSYSVCFTEPAQLTAGNPGYSDQCWSNTDKGHPTLLDLAGGQTRTGIDASMVGRTSISGTVFDPQYKPVIGVVVSARSVGGGVGSYTTTLTNTTGSYSFGHLDPGTYRVCFGNGQTAQGVALVGGCWKDDTTVTSQILTFGENPMLSPPGGITGVVKDDQGNPVSDVTIYLGVLSTPLNYESSAPIAVSATDGSYSLTGLMPGTYQVCFSPAPNHPGASPTGYDQQCFDRIEAGGTPATVTVQAGQTTAALNAQLHPTAGISGQVTDAAGNPLQNVRVVGSSGQAVVTDANGKYLIVAVSPGQQTVCFQASNATGGASSSGYQDSCYDTVAPTGTPTPITVTAHQTTTGIDQKLQAKPVAN